MITFDCISASWDFDKAFHGCKSTDGLVNLMHSFSGALSVRPVTVSEPTIDEDVVPNHSTRTISTSSAGSITSDVFGGEDSDGAMSKLIAADSAVASTTTASSSSASNSNNGGGSPRERLPGDKNGGSPRERPLKRIQSDLTETRVAQFYRERARFVMQQAFCLNR